MAGFANAQDGTDFIELLEGDTLYGNIWGVEPGHVRFESNESGKTAIVAMELLARAQYLHRTSGETGLLQAVGLMKWSYLTIYNIAKNKLVH